jgi:DNA-directed RNA polymerase II subunit RPB1
VFSEIDAMKGVSEKIIFGQNVNIGTGGFKIMIDRDTVKEYNAKGKKDKEENDEKVELFMNNFDSRQYGIDRTPIAHTPGPYGFGGKSMHAVSPYIFGGGTSSKSPLFTPMRSYHKQEFTQEYQPDLSVMHSPIAGGQTPLPFGQLGATPIAQSTSPVYNMAYTSNRIGSTYARSPHYNAIFNAASSSPNYSSSLRSHSPDYNTPGSRIGSPGGSPHSPSYVTTPLSVRRAPKDEEDDEEDEDDRF